MKKRLICLAVSLILVMQTMGGWSASAVEEPAAPDETGAPAAFADSGRVEAESSFAADFFMVTTVTGETSYRLEHWSPNNDGAPCLWGGSVTVADLSNGGWKLKPASGGHYCLLPASGTALTAVSETSVLFSEGYAMNEPAQQWDLVPSGEDPFDCKLVNVKYGTELTYAAPADNGVLVFLAPAGQGAVWAVQNLSKSEKMGQSAYLLPGDSPEGGDRVAAASNFASDAFTLETADGRWQVEHWAPGGNPDESACLWGAYSTSENLGNGAWSLTPVKDGYYCITAHGTTNALTAVSETVVSAEGHTLDKTDSAQMWSLVPDETTADPYDCKLVNAKYGTQLVYDKPAQNESVLRLAETGDGWAVRNLKQTDLLGFLAFVTPGPSEFIDWGDLEAIPVYSETGAVAEDAAYDGPQIQKVRVINEGTYLEIYWDRYVDEVQAINVENFVLKNGDKVIELEPKGNDYTNTLYFDKNNREIAATEANCMSRLSDDLHMSSICYLGEIGEIGPEGLTLEVKGGAIKDEDGNPAKAASYQGVPKVDFYTQFLKSQTGILIKADDTVDPDTLAAAAAQVDVELSRIETGIAANMAKYNCSLAIYSPRQNAYFIPEHRGAFRSDMYDVEGYGGNIYNNCVSSIAERNILRTRNNPDKVLNTAYPDENILIHEFGHCIKSVGIELLEDQTLADEMFDAYVNAKENGLWPNTYRISNSDEFFATMCAVWFNVMDEVDNWKDGTRCPLNTREELKQYDPQTYAFFEKILPSDTELPAPWNEHAPDIYHDEYVDPNPMSDLVESVDNNFETDLMMVEVSYRGEYKLIEKYAPDEARPDENLCLWWAYSDNPTDTTQNWAYKIVRTAEGCYRFNATSVEAAITATSDSTVAAEGHAPDAADTAQQWKFVENTRTANPFDGKLVNVKYGTELAFEKPFGDGSILYLAPAGEGANWLIRNTAQSAALEKKACLKPDAAAQEPDTPDEPDTPPIPSKPGKPGGTTTPKPSKDNAAVTKPEESTLPDGSKMTVETKTDGTKVTAIEKPDGTVGTTTETPSGAVSAAVTLSEAAAAGTARVALPLPEVPVGAGITVTVPGMSSVKVAVPVKNATPGTVAVLSGPDGTEKVFVKSAVSNGALSFTVPAGSTAVRLTDKGGSFTDTQGHWGADAVSFVTARGIFGGTGETVFSPDGSVTRGMLMTVLARYDGQDTTGGSTWYEKGVEWARSQNISDGTQPEQFVSRQELAVMLYRFAGQPASSGSIASFPDSASAASWAGQALGWAVETGLIVGTDSGALDPEGRATRAEAATILMRFTVWSAK